MKPAEVSTPDDTSVVIKRSFAAPVPLVWRAYTEADLLKQWCQGPPGWLMPVCEMDSRTGGTYRWRWKDDSSGTEFGFQGRFLDVVEHRRIEHTQIYDAGNLGMKTWIGDWLTQDSNSGKMIFNTAEQIAYLSERITLLPGDVIMTGTPAHSRSLDPGDRIEVSISPGAMALTRMPRGPKSCAISRVSAASAAFDVA